MDTSQKNRGLINVCLGSIAFSAIKVAMLSIALINFHLVKATVTFVIQGCVLKNEHKCFSFEMSIKVITISKYVTSLLVLKNSTIIQFAKSSDCLLAPPLKSLYPYKASIFSGTFSPEGTVTHILTEHFLLVKIMSGPAKNGMVMLDLDAHFS